MTVSNTKVYRLKEALKTTYDTIKANSELMVTRLDNQTGYMDAINLTGKSRINTYLPKTLLKTLELEEVRDITPKDTAVMISIQGYHGVTGGAYTDSIGTDPELFVMQANGKRVLPAWRFADESAKGKHTCKPYPDGPQVEFMSSIRTCLAYLTDDVQAGLRATLKAARKVDPTCNLSIANTCKLTKVQIAQAPKKYLEFGCDPSQNVYGLRGALDNQNIAMRSAGYHMHLNATKSSGNTTKEDIHNAIRAIDGVLGIYVTACAAGLEDPARRLLYGLPGEHRLKNISAGYFEYRVLGPVVMISPEFHHACWEIFRWAAKFGMSGWFDKAWAATEDDIISTILRCDVEGARKIMHDNKQMFIGLFNSKISNGAAAHELAMKGITELRPDLCEPNAIEREWKLNKTWISHSDDSKRVWALNGAKFIQQSTA